MGALVYSAIASLDGYVADEDGQFDWAAPDEEVHRFVNDHERRIGIFLLGRRMYGVMQVWDDPAAVDDQPGHVREFSEVWRAADKIVWSTTLSSVSTARTTLEHSLDLDRVRALKESDRDLGVGGPHLAGQLLEAGLVDEISLYLVPVVVGGGTPALPAGVRLDLALVEERRFGNGTVFLRYRTQ
jgi:dihydrofolate reductase